MSNKGEYIYNGYIRTSDGIVETKSFAIVRLIEFSEPFNADCKYYCEIEYKDEDGIKWDKKIHANDPFSAFELGIIFVHNIIAPNSNFPEFKMAENIELTKGEYIITGFMRTREKITDTKAYGKVEIAHSSKPYNSDLQYYCAIEYKDESGDNFKKDIFANSPHTAFALGVKFINSLISYHNGFPAE